MWCFVLSRGKSGLENQGVDTRVALLTITSNVSLREFLFPIPALLGFAELKFLCPKKTHTKDPIEEQVRVAARELWTSHVPGP